MQIPKLHFKDLELHQFDCVIDVRAPSEFTEDHIFGSINLPVLSDAERVLVGTTYKQESRFKALKIGAAFIAKNSVKRMLKKLDNGYDLVFLGFQSKKNNSYGKFKIGSKRSLLEIIESTEEGYSSELKLSNSGIILAKTKSISLLLPKLNNRNKRKEYLDNACARRCG